MARILITLFLMLTFAVSAQAQKRGRWASASERGLKGPVHVVVEQCSNIGDSFRYGYKYEFTRDRKLMVITSLQPERPAYNVSGGSWKAVKRNAHGDATEGSYFFMGELEHRERWEFEYDSTGNWTQRVAYIMREYEIVGSGTAGKWLAHQVCKRTVEYYPSGAT